MAPLPEVLAVQQGLIPPKGFHFYFNSVTTRGKKNIAYAPWGVFFIYYQLKSKLNQFKERRAASADYALKMQKCREEMKEWEAAGKVFPKRVLVENEKPLSECK